jgi:hypothetical protein
MATVFRTGHEINEKVCTALVEGFKDDDLYATYGILRGAGEWAKLKDGERINGHPKKVLLLDKGFFKPGHYDGYYRISTSGLTTQPRFDPTKCDPARWKSLGIEVETWRKDGSHILICPPTEVVAKFYGMDMWDEAWGRMMAEKVLGQYGTRFVVTIRTKGSTVPLADDLKNAYAIITFNSSVGWEALRQGIRVVSWWPYSTLGTWFVYHGGTTLDAMAGSWDHLNREELFSFMANHQFTLAEIGNGDARRYVL